MTRYQKSYAGKKRKGLCAWSGCHRRAAKGVLCRQHRAESKADGRKRRAKRKRNRLCHDCGEPALKGQTMCAAHAAAARARVNARTAKHRATGLCTSCSEPAAKDRALCTACMWRRYPETVRRAARDRGLPVRVSDETLRRIARMPCHYCGGMDPRGFNGIDCKVHDRGYVRGNMLPCCWLHNEWKANTPYDAFIAALRRTAKRLN